MKSSSLKQLEFEKENRKKKVRLFLRQLDKLTYQQIEKAPSTVWQDLANLIGIPPPSDDTKKVVLRLLKRRASRRY